MPQPSDVVAIRVLLFATYAELAGRESVDLMVRTPATVSDVVRQLRGSLPGAERIPERPLAALNQVHTRLDAAVSNGDELALLPPMAGG